MTIEKIYSEILRALKSLGKTDTTGDSIRKSSMYTNDIATILYALKVDLEDDLRAEQSKKNGRKNYAAVKRFMKQCEKSAYKPFLAVAHEREGYFFINDKFRFYITVNKDGLAFAPENSNIESKFKDDIDRNYDIIKNFRTIGTSYKIPYSVAQLKAWKKSLDKSVKPVFSIGYKLPQQDIKDNKQCYAAINIDALITAMEITGSDVLLTDDKYRLAMENENGDRVGILCIAGTSPEFQKI